MSAGRVGGVVARGHADRHGHRDLGVLELERRLLDELAHLVGEGERVGAVDLGQHDGELLAAVARQDVLAPDLALDDRRQLLEHVVAGEVAEAVVDRLEAIDVEQDQRQLATIALGARHFAVELLEEIAAVEHLRQTVDGGEAIDLLVVGVLDVAAREELEDGAADLDEVAVAQHVLVDELIVDVGAVGRAEVAQDDRLAGVDDLGVVARHRLLIDLHVRLRRAADDDVGVLEVVLAAELQAVDDDEAGVLADRLLRDLRDDGDDRLGPRSWEDIGPSIIAPKSPAPNNSNTKICYIHLHLLPWTTSTGKRPICFVN